MLFFNDPSTYDSFNLYTTECKHTNSERNTTTPSGEESHFSTARFVSQCELF